MKKRFIVLILTVAMTAMYGMSTAAFAETATDPAANETSTTAAATTNKIVKCNYYIHYVTDKSQINFTECGSSGQPDSNYTVGVAGTITKSADFAWTSSNGNNHYYTNGTSGEAISSSIITGAPEFKTTEDLQKLFDSSVSKMGGRTVKLESNSTYNVVWYVIKDQGGDYHVDGYVVVKPADVTYSLNYHSNTTDSVSDMPTNLSGQANGTSVDLSNVSQPTRKGYTFLGWSTKADDNNKVTSVTFNSSSIDLYAIWAPVSSATSKATVDTYKITYSAKASDGTALSGASLPADVESVAAGTSLQAYLGTASMTGYTFSHWEYESKTIDNTTALTVNKNAELIAVFDKAEVTPVAPTIPVTPVIPADDYNSGTVTDNSNDNNSGTVTNNSSDNNSGTVTNNSSNNKSSNSSSKASTGTASNVASNSNVPDTGDTSDMIPWAVIALAGIAVSGVLIKRHNN